MPSKIRSQVGTPPDCIPGSHLDRLRQTKRVSYTADYAAEGIPAPPVTLGGARSTVDVPMLKDNELVGAGGVCGGFTELEMNANERIRGPIKKLPEKAPRQVAGFVDWMQFELQSG